jgi:elongation factor Ts
MAYVSPYRELHAYVHNGRIGVLLEIGCESDFLLRLAAFRSLMNDIAMHIAAMAPVDAEQLYSQPYFRDPSRTVAQVLQEATATYRERVVVSRFIRWSTEDEAPTPGTMPPKSPAVILAFPKVSSGGGS